MAGRNDFTLVLGLEGVSNVVTGLNQAIELGVRLISVIRDLIRDSDEYAQASRGHYVSIESAARATADLVDQLTLHRQAGRLEQAQMMLTEQQFRALAVAALDFARATGTDSTRAMEQLTNAVISGESEGLRRYGFRLQANMTLEQRRAEVLRQLTERTGDQTRSVQSLSEALRAGESRWDDYRREVGMVLQEDERLIDLTTQVERRLEDLLPDINTTADAIASFTLTLVDFGAGIVQVLGPLARLVGYFMQIQAATSAVQIVPLITGAAERQWRAGAALAAGGEDAFAAAEATRQQIADAGDRETRRTPIAGLPFDAETGSSEVGDELTDILGEGPAPPQTHMRRRQRQRGGGSGESGWAMSAADRLLIAQEAALDAFSEQRRQWEEGEAERHRRWMEENLRSELGLIQKHEQARTRAAEVMARARQRIAAREHAEKVGMMNAEAKQEEERRQRYEQAASVVGELGAVFSQVGDAVEVMAGKHSAATKVIAAVEGAFLVAYNVVKAATAVADAVGAFAKQDYVAGALFVIQAALHTAAAISAAAKLGASLAGSGGDAKSAAAAARSGAGGQRRNRPEWYQGDRVNRQGEQVTNINFYGPVTSRRAHEDLDAQSRESSRRAA